MAVAISFKKAIAGEQFAELSKPYAGCSNQPLREYQKHSGQQKI
jgi:hypothetical protein